MSNASVFTFVPALSKTSVCWHLAVGPGYCHGVSVGDCPAEVAVCRAGGSAVLHLPSLALHGNRSVQLVFKSYHDCGLFDVKVGNTIVQTVDAFEPSPGCNWWTTAAVPAGTETISIVATGRKNDSSTNSFVQIIGIQIRSEVERQSQSARNGLLLRTDDIDARMKTCEFAARRTMDGVCFIFGGIAKLPPGPFTVPGRPAGSAFHPPVVVAPPCQNVTAAQTNCTEFSTSVRAAPAFWEGGGTKCYALGALSSVATTGLVNPLNASAGVTVTYTGGDGGRTLVYRLICDRRVPSTAGPTEVSGMGMTYTVQWATPLACAATLNPHSNACGPLPLPPTQVARPSIQQLDWMDMEVAAMVCFNLQTICADRGPKTTSQKCQKYGYVPTAATTAAWNPSGLDTDEWARVSASFGAKYIILVAGHMSGFTLWDTKVHNFSIAHTRYKGGGQDVVRDLLNSCKKYNLKLGFFYSVHFNWYLGVNNFEVGWPPLGPKGYTQAEYLAIAKAQLQEVIDLFGAEGPVEVWFDGTSSTTFHPVYAHTCILRSQCPQLLASQCRQFTADAK